MSNPVNPCILFSDENIGNERGNHEATNTFERVFHPVGQDGIEVRRTVRAGFGLSLLVKARAGEGFSKTFSQRLRVHGQPVYIGLGAYPLIRLSEAREIAIDNARMAAHGGDPRQPKVSTVPTFAELAEVVIEQGAASWATATTQDWRAAMARHIYPKLGARPVNQITAQDLLGVLEPINRATPTAAEKVRRYVATVVDRAVGLGHRSDNPAVAVRSLLPANGHKVQHQAAMPHADIGAALARLREMDAYTGAKDALEFLILTATRTGEVTGARWTEIDLDAATWTIPGSRTKTSSEHVAVLSRMAVAVLERAKQYIDATGLVFPSARGGQMHRPILTRVLSKIAKTATVHGFRSSFRDWCAETGVDRALAESALGHVTGGVEGAYLRSTLTERRRPVMQAWADYLSS